MQTQNHPAKKNTLLPFLYLIVIGVLSRLLPHPPNMTALAGIGLFTGAYIASPFAFLIPLVIMFCSDIILGFHSSILFVYGSFILIFFFGRWFSKKKNFLSLCFSSLLSSLVFFLITNAGAWATFDMYPKNMQGLIDAYIMGLPFLKFTLVGDLFYTTIIFYSYQLSNLLVEKKINAKRT